jgi:3-hydroxyacyl-CoA dehydrogenase
VIGSELGSGIASILPILVSKFYFDIVPRELTEAEAKKGLTLEIVVRNRLVNDLNTAVKAGTPLHQQFANRITTGNTTDDMAKLPMSIGLSKLLSKG